jgi:hypothetical protein
MGWNPLKTIHDSQKRKEYKAVLLGLLARTQKAGDGIQISPGEGESGIWSPVIEEILRENRQYSLAMWPEGPAIVRTADIDALNADFRQVNESAQFLNRGGQDFNIEEIKPRPTGGERVKAEEWEKEIGQELDKPGYENPFKKE